MAYYTMDRQKKTNLSDKPEERQQAPAGATGGGLFSQTSLEKVTVTAWTWSRPVRFSGVK